MKALKIAGIVVLTLVSIVAVVIAVRSPRSHLERSIIIQASASDIFPYFNNFKNFNEWSPGKKADTTAVHTYQGPESGVGAKESWVSNDPDIGAGSQWIVASEENKRVKAALQFASMKGEFFSEVVLEPVEGGTRVTYHYDGDVSNTSLTNAAAGKFFGLFVDNMLGEQYEKGLDDLKILVESQHPANPETQP